MSPFLIAIAVVATPVVAVIGFAIVRAALFKSRQIERPTVRDATHLDAEQAAERLAQAIQYRTISHEESDHVEAQELVRLHVFLEHSYPRVHSSLSKEVVGDYSLLYTWKGTRTDVKPILLMAHLDVVPVESEDKWTHPPFAGTIADGYIWGRGSMDVKSGVLGALEAVELLLKDGFKPRRTVYLAFGHDEEVGGLEGATLIADLLGSRDIDLEYILDEGLFITHGLVPGVSAPVAIAAVAEKGFLSVELTVKCEGGHSSAPPSQTCVGILAAAIDKIEQNPLPASLKGPAWHLFEFTGPEMSFINRLVFANRWLLGWVVERRLASTPTTNALIRTTAAATVIEGGVKENVLPTSARAVVNFRILPSDSLASVVDHVRGTVSDPRVAINPLDEHKSAPSDISDINAPSFHTLVQTIRQVFPEVVVAPSLLVARTDSIHYRGLTKNIYRFLPQRIWAGDVERIHGTDERISIDNYAEVIRFYAQLIRNSA